jgi:hypothetical protein
MARITGLGGRSMRTQVRGALLLLLASAVGCAGYKQSLKSTNSIWSVTVTTNREDVKNCRRVAFVNANDAQRGCGLTVQPSTQECLQYQVLLAGGDTLLSNGFVGEAYRCSDAAPSPTPSELPATPTPTAIPAPQPVPSLSPTPAATSAPVPLKTSPAPASSGVRLVQLREAVKGCVYLGDIDLRAECPADGTGTPISCIAERAARAGGNTVLIDGDRAPIFSCKAKSN